MYIYIYIYSYHPRPRKKLGQLLIEFSSIYKTPVPMHTYRVPGRHTYYTLILCIYIIYMCTGLGTISIQNYIPIIYVYTHYYRHARIAEKYDLLSGPPMRALGTLLSHQSLSGLNNRDRRKSRTMRVLCNGIRRLPMTVIMHIRLYIYMIIYV